MLIAILLYLQAGSATDTLYLSLEDALTRAHDANPTVLAERAEARAAAQDVLSASRAFLPSVHLGIQGFRTTDPVAAFGGRLRQERFAQEDFALDALNRPDPFGNWTASASAEMPLIAPEGWFGYRAARRGVQAREAAADRASGVITFHVTQAYWGALIARERVAALDTALTAARAHADQANALREQGMVTGLDARLVRIRMAETEAQRLTAVAEAENALTALRALLALPDDAPIAVADELAAPDASTCGAQCEIANRADITALTNGLEAASAGLNGARAANLPSVGLFATIAHHSPTAPWANGSGDWIVGIAFSWRPFQGLAGIGAVRRARAEYDGAASRLDAAERQAALEVAQAERRWEAARARVVVATQAAAEAAEALNQARTRYRTGISDITELLDVQAAATSADLTLLAARYDVVMSQAAVDLAYGVYDR